MTLLTVAPRLWASVGQPIAINAERPAVRVSIGAAVCPGHGDTAEGLLAGADRAMCIAKREQCGLVLAETTEDLRG